jgi:outer membrane protein OmpA-like peptidoglycan-associated protein
MFDEADRETGFALAIAIALAIFVSIFTIGIAAGSAVGQFGRKPAAAAPAPMSAAAPAARTLTVKLYFEVGKADLPADALTRLAPLVQATQDSKSALVVSGYHDASGDAAANAELAKQRAFAVRDLLATAGVSEQRIELAKPAVTTGGTDAREARRVDVTLR